MRLVFNPQATGTCHKCGEHIHGGYMVVDDDNQVSKVLCPLCRDFEKDLDIKKAKVVLKQAPSTWFWKKYYEVVSSKNILFKVPILDYKEVHRLVLCKDIDVDIKY